MGYPDGSFAGLRSGAAVAKVNGVRLIVVPGNYLVDDENEVHVKIFRYHPCGSYDPLTGPAPEITTIVVAKMEKIASTPLVYRASQGGTPVLVVQTDRYVRCYALNMINPTTACSAFSYTAEPLWQFPPGDPLHSVASSPALGAETTLSESARHVYVLGRPNGGAATYLYALDPDEGTVNWSRYLRDNDEGLTTPAVGPVEADTQDRNFVYVTLKAPTSGMDFWAVFADGGGTAYYSTISTSGQPGSYSSPGVQDDGDVIVPADNRRVLGFDNLIPTPPATGLALRFLATTTNCNVADWVSSTAGLFSDRRWLLWTESSRRFLLGTDDEGVSQEVVGTRSGSGGTQQWIWGSPALDNFDRAFSGSLDGNLRAVRNFTSESPVECDLDEQEWLRIRGAWTLGSTERAYFPPTSIAGGTNLRQSSRSGPAIDLDGSVVVANEGYVFVVRPLLADFTGDGCRNNFDVDAFVLALMDPASWHATIGIPGGVNLLGVGDCNNDGVFDNHDIDCFVDLVINDFGCPAGELDLDDQGGQQQQMASGGGSSESSGIWMEEAQMSQGPSEDDLSYFHLQIAVLRAYFEME
ncbi:MAG: hypothetical protein HRU75_06455 [Planctomycetia bacterium]|nr:MAG: hypothetical protein HRU75_06455 [Planctomycetia bacterium]